MVLLVVVEVGVGVVEVVGVDEVFVVDRVGGVEVVVGSRWSKTSSLTGDEVKVGVEVLEVAGAVPVLGLASR